MNALALPTFNLKENYILVISVTTDTLKITTKCINLKQHTFIISHESSHWLGASVDLGRAQLSMTRLRQASVVNRPPRIYDAFIWDGWDD